MDTKKQSGSFYTKNYDYILNCLNIRDIIIPDKNQSFIEPFVGEGDLIKYMIKQNIGFSIESYDIQNKIKLENFKNTDMTFEIRDTLKTPPSYTDKIVITNPPFLYRNKSKNKDIFNMYNTNDLYKCFLLSIINDTPDGGVLILPLNFFSSIRKDDINLRYLFFSKFKILRLNIFQERVFSDTSINVCSFIFKKGNEEQANIPTTFIPSGIYRDIILCKKHGWLYGGEIYNVEISKNIVVNRLVGGETDLIPTSILLTAIDERKTKINIRVSDTVYEGKSTSRTMATIAINKHISIDTQKVICEEFNKLLNEYRDKYSDLFLNNFRDNNRKRISFSLAYKLINHVITVKNL